jgi:group I intron endonuclease
MASGLYKITHKETGRVYIGQSKNITARWYAHRSKTDCGNSYVKKAIKKYGSGAFEFSVLVYAEDQEYLNELEMAAIKSYGSLRPFGFNLRKGGYSSGFSEESRKKMSAARKAFMAKDDNAAFYKDAISKLRPDQEAYKRQAKTMSSLKWMNNGLVNERVLPDRVQERLDAGFTYGRLHSYINDKYRETQRANALRQWSSSKDQEV